jgi:hypothetical protein
MTDMRCPGCGAEMHLIEVAPDKTKMVPGYEQHTFECSGCHDHVRQLVFIPRAIGPLNSEEMRLSAAWLEILNKGTTPKGDDSARAVRAVSPIKAVYVVGMLTIIAVAGSLIIWGQSSKGPMGDQGPPGPKGPQGDAAHRAQPPAFRSLAQTAMRRPAACNAVRTRAFNRLLWRQTKPCDHPNRASCDVPQSNAGEQPSRCGVRADGGSIASAAQLTRHRRSAFGFWRETGLGTLSF